MIKDVYKIVFRGKLKLSQARDEIMQKYDVDDPDIGYYLEFFDRVERGIVR